MFTKENLKIICIVGIGLGAFMLARQPNSNLAVTLYRVGLIVGGITGFLILSLWPTRQPTAGVVQNAWTAPLQVKEEKSSPSTLQT